MMEGKEFLGTSSYEIELHQNTNDHDYFIIDVPDDSLDSFGGYVLEHSKNVLGKRVTLNFHRFGEIRQTFVGVITSLKNKKENGYGRLYIKVSGPGMLLESGAHCQSFENQTLDQIIKSVTAEYSEDCKIEVESLNTAYALPYTVQYKESDYQFLTRLASRYGEYFYYNGQQLLFGNTVQPIIKLEENMDLMDVEFELMIKPQHFNHLSYDSETGSRIEKSSASVQIQYKENPFQAVAINASKSVYSKKPTLLFNHTGISSSSDREVKESVRRERENRENLVQVKGRSRDPELKLGGRAKLSDINSKAMETFRIIEITHYHNGNTYYNEFVGIPDLFNAPYQDNEALPLGEKQSAKVLDNNDPMGMGRVRVQFPWQEAKNQKTPWIRLIQPHSGAGKGFHFIPEIGEEVLIGYEGGNAEKPFVLGTHYNGGETSSFHTSGNDLKVTKTRSGHTIIMDDSEDKMSITILDISGNMIYLDTVKKSITITAPETIDIICKNLNIKVEENMKTNVGHNQENTIGKNIKTIAKEEISQDSGKKTILASGDNMEISANKDLDLYGKKNLIGFTDGKTEFGAKEQMHVYGMTSLITAKDKIEYKAPKMNKLAESGKFKHDKEKQILSVKWMDAQMNEKIGNASFGDKVSLLVHTRNYEEGENISLKIKKKDDKEVKDGVKELTLSGKVNKDGFAELKEELEIEKSKKEEAEKEEQQKLEEDKKANEVYKTFEGKDYNFYEWQVFDENNYKDYCKRTGRAFIPREIEKPKETPKNFSFLADEEDIKPVKKKGFWG